MVELAGGDLRTLKSSFGTFWKVEYCIGGSKVVEKRERGRESG